MKTLYALTFSIMLLGVQSDALAQQFKNGDLNGDIDGVSSMPTSWEAVPHTDKVCYASDEFEATPDLTNNVGFTVVEGIRGTPYSGNSFVAALDYGRGKHHEGIMQKLNGLKPGETYQISFHQAVIKQYNALDTSGSWAVYSDNKLLKITEVSSSQLHYNDLNVNWEERTVEFKATKKSHVIKFMPTDDDNTYNYSDKNGNLRMGIDLIEIIEAEVIVDEPEIDTVIVVDIPDPIDTLDTNVETLKLPDTTKLDIIRLITTIDPETHLVTNEIKEPKEVIFQRPGPLEFKIVAEIDVLQMSNPGKGAFRVVTKEDSYTLTITDMRGRVIKKIENCSRETKVNLERAGHFLIVVENGRYRTYKKLIVE